MLGLVQRKNQVWISDDQRVSCEADLRRYVMCRITHHPQPSQTAPSRVPLQTRENWSVSAIP
jgi:hypothetical protein